MDSTELLKIINKKKAELGEKATFQEGFMAGYNIGCDGCKNEPKKGENYPIECGECKRWYGDGFIAK
jgi:hypothetical protein